MEMRLESNGVIKEEGMGSRDYFGIGHVNAMCAKRRGVKIPILTPITFMVGSNFMAGSKSYFTRTL
jgi:hypothetical protein